MINILPLLPIAITGSYLQTAYRSYAWEPPESWKENQIVPHEEIRNLARKTGLRKDLKFYSFDLGPDNCAVAFGNNGFPASKIAIVVNSADLINKKLSDSGDISFILKHEFAHIKNNDLFFRDTIVAVTSVASLVFGLTYMTPLFTSLLVCFLARTSFICYSRFMERRADKHAIENSSIKELNSWLTVIKQNLRRNLILHEESFKGKIDYSHEGNCNRDWEHDSLTTRMRQIEAALQ